MQQARLLCELQTPLEQSFLIEALEYQEDFQNIFKKYQPLLSLQKTGLHACICSFVEETYLKYFLISIKRILWSQQITLSFPTIYVKNSAILIFPAPTLTLQKKLKENLTNLEYPNQSVSFEVSFLHTDTTCELFKNIVTKISRFERILIVNEISDGFEIKNHLSAPWRISQIAERITASKDSAQLQHILDSIFMDTLLLHTGKNIALSLFLKLNAESENNFLDIACDFFKRLYSCCNVSEIRELMFVVLSHQTKENAIDSNSSYIFLLKSYVDKHLSSVNLSLKWLAENYLFVSLGYLSKQFVKEEGIRFSDYLNKKRVEEAKRLMSYYHTDNIKYIAQQVGFRNNPQYFGQVFKRYTGLTPTKYLKDQS